VRYTVGSKVVHPRLGAGTVMDIQEKAIGDLRRTYYVIDPVAKSMELMVPVELADDLGLRPAKDALEVRCMLSACGVAPEPEMIESDSKLRREGVRKHLRSGRFSAVVEAVRTLFYVNTERPLGLGDRQLLKRGKELLAGELALALDLDMNEAMQEVEDRLAEMLPHAENETTPPATNVA